MYNHELTLISYEVREDEIGNETKVEVKEKILCKISSVGSDEFYKAAVVGLKPELKFIVHAFEYDGQREVEFEGNKYKITRTFQGDSRYRTLKFDEIELTVTANVN